MRGLSPNWLLGTETLHLYIRRRFKYFAVVLDADGNLLSANGTSGSAYTVAVQDSDVSSISVYLCDYDEYMDELKGYYFSADYQEKAKTKTFKQLLDEHAVASDTKIITALSNLNKSKIKPRYFQSPVLKVPGFLLYGFYSMLTVLGWV